MEHRVPRSKDWWRHAEGAAECRRGSERERGRPGCGPPRRSRTAAHKVDGQDRSLPGNPRCHPGRGRGYQCQVSFDTIPHDKLLDRVREKISDGRVLSLIEQFLHQGVLEELKRWTPEAGTPQGAVISPLLANLYLNPLDHKLAAAGFEMVRYADDFVILCRSREEAERALALVQQWTADQRLTLHPTKTKIVDAATDGFDFLGYTFRGRLRLPREKSLDKFRSTLRAKTKRTRSGSLRHITAELTQTLCGWFQYFRYSWPTVFVAQDQYLRGRLRSLLRKRSKRRGVAKGADHQRWPNAFFHDLGLFSLTAAHAKFSQSSRR